MHKFLTVAFFALAELTILSCSEDNDELVPNRSNNLYISQYPIYEITYTEGETDESETVGNSIYATFSYDVQNRITHIDYDHADMYDFTYNPFKVICNQWDGITAQKTSSNGYISHLEFKDGDRSFLYDFSYDNKNHLIKIQRTIDNSTLTTSINWESNSIGSVLQTDDNYGADNPFNNIISEHEVKNNHLQWTTCAAQMLGLEEAILPLALGGFLGEAPEYLPSTITTISGGTTVISNYWYKFNKDNTIACENGYERFIIGSYEKTRTITMYYNYNGRQ